MQWSIMAKNNNENNLSNEGNDCGESLNVDNSRVDGFVFQSQREEVGVNDGNLVGQSLVLTKPNLKGKDKATV